MTDLLATLQPHLVAAALAVLSAATAWAVAWFRARQHAAESAVRQAQAQHGDTEAALQAALEELHRMPRRYRSADPDMQVRRAAERVRKRCSGPPQRPFPHPAPPPLGERVGPEPTIPLEDRPTIRHPRAQPPAARSSDPPDGSEGDR